MSTFDKPDLPGQPKTDPKKVPWVWGQHQTIQAKREKFSHLNIKNPFYLSSQASASGVSGNGTVSTFTTTLTPQPPHLTEMNYAIPYVAIYWGTAGVGSLQIWPNLGAGIGGTAFSVTAGFDWHLFSGGTPGSVIASFAGKIVNNSGGNGTLQLVTQWQYINLNSGTSKSA